MAVNSTTKTPSQYEIANDIKLERFQFVVTLNNAIVCQRYFRIGGYKSASAMSLQLYDTFKECADLIDKDLKDKAILYTWASAPQMFDDMEQAKTWLNKYGSTLEVPSFFAVRDTKTVYAWHGNGEYDVYDATKYPDSKYNHFNEYFENTPVEENKSYLVFKFLDNGKEIMSRSIDITQYPFIVRSNIDLSNTKNKYKSMQIFAPYECAMIEYFNSIQKDIVNDIISRICKCCSASDKTDYDTNDVYGKTKYNFNINSLNYNYEKKVERQVAKKTARYFNSL